MKDTMYAESKDNVARRSAQTAMYEILKTLVAMVSPVLSFTAEEVWKYMPKEEGMRESVMLQDWPQGHPEHFNQELADKMCIRDRPWAFLIMKHLLIMLL